MRLAEAALQAFGRRYARPFAARPAAARRLARRSTARAALAGRARHRGLLEFSQWLERLPARWRLAGDCSERAGHATIRNGAARCGAAVGRFRHGEPTDVRRSDNADQYRYSFDMLGEAALTYPGLQCLPEPSKAAIEAVALSRRGSPVDGEHLINRRRRCTHVTNNNLPQLR